MADVPELRTGDLVIWHDEIDIVLGEIDCGVKDCENHVETFTVHRGDGSTRHDDYSLQAILRPDYRPIIVRRDGTVVPT